MYTEVAVSLKMRRIKQWREARPFSSHCCSGERVVVCRHYNSWQRFAFFIYLSHISNQITKLQTGNFLSFNQNVFDPFIIRSIQPNFFLRSGILHFCIFVHVQRLRGLCPKALKNISSFSSLSLFFLVSFAMVVTLVKVRPILFYSHAHSTTITKNYGGFGRSRSLLTIVESLTSSSGTRAFLAFVSACFRKQRRCCS